MPHDRTELYTERIEKYPLEFSKHPKGVLSKVPQNDFVSKFDSACCHDFLHIKFQQLNSI